MVVTPVQVKVFNLEWLFKDGRNFVTFVQVLQKADSSLYSTDFVHYILEEFWSKY